MGAPFGLDGFVKVKPFSGETGHFSRVDNVILSQDGKEKTWDIAEIISRGEGLLIRFAGIDSPQAAGALKGAQIIAGREHAAPLKEGEYYVEDLKGLEVVTVEGKVLGHITDVIEGGGGQLVELELSAGLSPGPLPGLPEGNLGGTFGSRPRRKVPAPQTRLAPFRKEFFGDISLEEGKIVLLEPWILD